MKSRNAFTSVGFLLLLFSATTALPNGDKTYRPRDDDEVQLISLILNSEIASNGWSPKDLICFSVQGLDPSRALVKTLKLRELNVTSPAEWRKQFNCGLEVRLTYQYAKLAPAQALRVHVEVLDLREINDGSAHLATMKRSGNYSVLESAGKWAIKEYIPAK
ncbi:MAG TPA: hypothetical protein VGD60_03135 [Candidatus Acidoferrales bacterium]